MNRAAPFLLAALLPALAVGEGVTALKTAAGVLVVWDVPDSRFSVELPGKEHPPFSRPPVRPPALSKALTSKANS